MLEEGRDTAVAILPFCIIAVSFGSIFIRLSNAHPISIAFYRLLFSSIILSFFIPKYIPEIRDISRKKWIVLISTGAFLAIHFAAWISSLTYTTVASSVILVSAHPLIVAWISQRYLGEETSRKAYIAILLALIGIFIMTSSNYNISRTFLYGDILAIIGMLGVAGYIVRGRQIRRDMSLVPYAFLVYIFTTIFLGLFSLGFSETFTIYPAREYGLFILMAIIPHTFGHTVYNWVLKYLKARVVSISLLGEPVGATILAFFILNETPPLLTVIGGVITLLAIYLCTRYR
ncbi:MAG: DMT family transporter [Candidatus Saliniplasma sp.]